MSNREQMREAEVAAFLTHLAVEQQKPLPFLAEAKTAMLFFNRDFLHRDRGGLNVTWANPRAANAPPGLLDQGRTGSRVCHYALNTKNSYVSWVRRSILFHHKQHPLDLNEEHVEAFLTHLAVDGQVAVSTQSQALHALLFLYRWVLEVDLGPLDAVRARRPEYLPVVWLREEVRAVLEQVRGAEGVYPIMARLLYGAGLRVSECCRLRVKDVHLDRRQIFIRAGKGRKDRVVMLPKALHASLESRLAWRREVHAQDRAAGEGWVHLQNALERKYPRAPWDLGWQYVFASRCLSQDPRSPNRGRTHLQPGGLQRSVAAVSQAPVCNGRAGRKVSAPFRNAFDRGLSCATCTC